MWQDANQTYDLNYKETEESSVIALRKPMTFRGQSLSLSLEIQTCHSNEMKIQDLTNGIMVE